MASEIPDLEIVLPDGRPVSEFMEEEADLSTEIEFEGDPEGEITEVITVEISEMENPFYDNLAETIADDDPQVLAQVASNLSEDFEGDLSARKDWLQTYADGMELLGLKIEDRSEPWAGACGVFHPLLSEALVKFQAETVMETMPPGGPVKTKIIGKETKENKRASINVAANMNYYIQEKMPEYHRRQTWIELDTVLDAMGVEDRTGIYRALDVQ